MLDEGFEVRALSSDFDVHRRQAVRESVLDEVCDCYTAGGPTKLTGYLTITDTKGREVTNPVFEFDGCFDPNGNNQATGVLFPSLLSVTSTLVTPDAHGNIGLQIGCGTGSGGCSGSITATTGSARLGTVPFDVKEETITTLPLPVALPQGAKEVTFQLRLATGVGPSDPVTLPLQHP